MTDHIVTINGQPVTRAMDLIPALHALQARIDQLEGEVRRWQHIAERLDQDLEALRENVEKRWEPNAVEVEEMARQSQKPLG